jgi:hypothetical protein
MTRISLVPRRSPVSAGQRAAAGSHRAPDGPGKSVLEPAQATTLPGADRGGSPVPPWIWVKDAVSSGGSGAFVPAARPRGHDLPGERARAGDHDKVPAGRADREGIVVMLLENAQDVGDLLAAIGAGPTPADHDPLADIGRCEPDLEPVAHACHLFPGSAPRAVTGLATIPLPVETSPVSQGSGPVLAAALAVPYQAQREADRHIARGGPHDPPTMARPIKRASTRSQCLDCPSSSPGGAPAARLPPAQAGRSVAG